MTLSLSQGDEIVWQPKGIHVDKQIRASAKYRLAVVTIPDATR
jgi:hypothetical protein